MLPRLMLSEVSICWGVGLRYSVGLHRAVWSCAFPCARPWECFGWNRGRLHLGRGRFAVVGGLAPSMNCDGYPYPVGHLDPVPCRVVSAGAGSLAGAGRVALVGWLGVVEDGAGGLVRVGAGVYEGAALHLFALDFHLVGEAF